MQILHIFDSYAQDQEIKKEDETTMEVEYINEEEEDDDDEFKPRWKRRSGNSEKTFQEKQSMVIQLFGSTAEGKPIRLQVNGFQPFFFLRLDDEPSSFDKCKRRFLALFDERKIPYSCVKFEKTKKKVLYGYTAGREFTFMQLNFKNLSVFRAVKKLVLDDHQQPIFVLYKGEKPLEVYDANLDPMLRFFIFGSYSRAAGSRLRWSSRKRRMYLLVNVNGIRLILNSHHRRLPRRFSWHPGILSVTANQATFPCRRGKRSSQSSARALILVKSRATP